MYKVIFKIKNQYQKIIVRPEIKSSTSKHHINVPTFISSNLLLTTLKGTKRILRFF